MLNLSSASEHKARNFSDFAMAETSAPISQANDASCPVSKLPPELREMIYQYYFGDMKKLDAATHLPEYGWHYDEDEEHTKWQCVWQVRNFKLLKPYLSMLHLSSVVRSETAPYMYKAAFTNAWFKLEIDRDTDDIELMKGMFAQLHEVNRDVKFGLHFTVSDHSRDTFFEFIDSFFNIHATDDYIVPTFIRCKKDCETKSLMLSSSSGAKIQYTYKTESKDFHRLWMFGTLARLDWSKFELKLPPPLRLKSRVMDSSLDDPTRLPHCKGKISKTVADVDSYESEGDGIDVDLDSDNEVIAFNSDDDDNEAMIFDGGDEDLIRDDECDSEYESRWGDSEDEAVSDDDEYEEWIRIPTHVCAE
jgi:hypothetical protein